MAFMVIGCLTMIWVASQISAGGAAGVMTSQSARFARFTATQQALELKYDFMRPTATPFAEQCNLVVGREVSCLTVATLTEPERLRWVGTWTPEPVEDLGATFAP